MKTLKLLASEGDFAKDQIPSEFVRAVLLNGNGTLLINNTFVEWASIQAARRASFRDGPIELEIFYQYLWQKFEKYAEYRKNTAYLFVGEGMDELFYIAPADFPLQSARPPVKLPPFLRP